MSLMDDALNAYENRLASNREVRQLNLDLFSQALHDILRVEVRPEAFMIVVDNIHLAAVSNMQLVTDATDHLEEVDNIQIAVYANETTRYGHCWQTIQSREELGEMIQRKLHLASAVNPKTDKHKSREIIPFKPLTPKLRHLKLPESPLTAKREHGHADKCDPRFEGIFDFQNSPAMNELADKLGLDE